MALPGWFDPFGLKVISGIEDCGPLTRPFVVFNGLEVFFKIGLRTSKGFGKIFFWGFTGFRTGAIGGEKGCRITLLEMARSFSKVFAELFNK